MKQICSLFIWLCLWQVHFSQSNHLSERQNKSTDWLCCISLSMLLLVQLYHLTSPSNRFDIHYDDVVSCAFKIILVENSYYESLSILLTAIITINCIAAFYVKFTLSTTHQSRSSDVICLNVKYKLLVYHILLDSILIPLLEPLFNINEY